MKKRKLTKRQDGKRLNEEGRLSPLEILQRRMEHFAELAEAEKAKGAACSREQLHEFLREAQSAAIELAPYRHPKLQATAVVTSTTSDLSELLDAISARTTSPLPPHVQKLLEAENAEEKGTVIDGNATQH